VSSRYLLADFVRDVESRYKPAEPETFWECEPAIRRLLAQGALSNWVNQQLRALIDDPQRLGNWMGTEAQLHHEKNWSVSVAIFDSPRRFIHLLPFMGIYAPLGSDLKGARYRLPAGLRSDVFDPALRLEPAGTIAAVAGELIRLETTEYAYDFLVPRPVPVLRFTSASFRPLEWLFSKTTLQAWQANDADLSSTQLRVAAYVLGRIAHDSSVKPLKDLATHPHHAVRWAAIQSLGRLSRSEALAKIREAVNDSHPHVRRAAQKTLDQLDRKSPR
jgi:hypothetical protein